MGYEPKAMENISNVMPVPCWLYISLPASNTNKKKLVKPLGLLLRNGSPEKVSHFVDDSVMLNLFSFQDPRYENSWHTPSQVQVRILLNCFILNSVILSLWLFVSFLFSVLDSYIWHMDIHPFHLLRKSYLHNADCISHKTKLFHEMPAVWKAGQPTSQFEGVSIWVSSIFSEAAKTDLSRSSEAPDLVCSLRVQRKYFQTVFQDLIPKI